MLVHNANDTTVNQNLTLMDTNATTVHASHVGQIFFDQNLISQVENTYPYRENTQNLTLNQDDSILGEEAASMDPFVEYIWLGDKIEDGIFAWITIGIDPTQSSVVSSAATLYESGGVENENSAMGMGGGPAGKGTDGGPPTSGSGVPVASASST